MIGIDRRGLMLATAAAAVALAVPSRLTASPVRPALFVTDTRIPAGVQAAHRWRAEGVRVIDRAHEDLGQAWHSVIPAALKDRSGAIAGLTLWVDSYICEAFGRDHGLAIERAAVSAGEVMHGWVLKPAPTL